MLEETEKGSFFSFISSWKLLANTQTQWEAEHNAKNSSALQAREEKSRGREEELQAKEQDLHAREQAILLKEQDLQAREKALQRTENK